MSAEALLEVSEEDQVGRTKLVRVMCVRPSCVVGKGHSLHHTLKAFRVNHRNFVEQEYVLMRGNAGMRQSDARMCALECDGGVRVKQNVRAYPLLSNPTSTWTL